MQEINLRTVLWIGDDALSKLSELSENKIALITDPFMASSGMVNKVLEPLKGKDVMVFSEIKPDPDIELITKGLIELEKNPPEVIIALGGGSSIDAAKAMLFFGKKAQTIQVNKFIAVPTTSGTGSEVTSFSVVTDAMRAVKIPIVTDEILPDIAILDTTLVMTVPANITADTGMDVMAHLLESYVSTKSNVIVEALVEYAIRLVFENLTEVYKHGTNATARENMHVASCLAGLAFNMASLGLVHGIAHSIGGKYHIPHGKANAIILPTVISYNAQKSVEANKRYARIARLLHVTSSGNDAIATKSLIRKIIELKRIIKIPNNLIDAGISKETIIEDSETLVQNILNDSCTATNPHIPSVEDVKTILMNLTR